MSEAIKLMKNADMTEKKGTLWNIHTKMGKEFLTYGNIKIEKEKQILPSKDSFYFFYFLFFSGDVDIEKVLVSKKICEKTILWIL